VFLDTPKRNVKKQDQPVSNSWYAEVGLWEMSTSSPNDSSVSEQGIVMARAGVTVTVLDLICNFYLLVHHVVVQRFWHTVMLKLLDTFQQ
jgi:hypothetical protein